MTEKLTEEGKSLKAELGALFRKRRLLKSLSRQIEEQQKSIGCLSGGGSGVQSNKISDTTAQYAIRLQTLRERYSILLDEIMSTEDDISNNVYTLPPNEQAIIIDRYMNGLSWETIAINEHYCERTVIRLHNSALNKLAKEKNADKMQDFANK